MDDLFNRILDSDDAELLDFGANLKVLLEAWEAEAHKRGLTITLLNRSDGSTHPQDYDSLFDDDTSTVNINVDPFRGPIRCKVDSTPEQLSCKGKGKQRRRYDDISTETDSKAETWWEQEPLVPTPYQPSLKVPATPSPSHPILGVSDGARFSPTHLSPSSEEPDLPRTDAWTSNAAIIADIMEVERQSFQDRATAVRMSGQTPAHFWEDETPDISEIFARYEHSAKAVARPSSAGPSKNLFGGSRRNKQTMPTPSSSRTGQESRVPTPGKREENSVPETFQCISCADPFSSSRISRLDCGHHYCSPCLKTFVFRGVKERDLSVLPPRCCKKPVSMPLIESVLSKKELEAYCEAILEKDTPNKVYCANKSCGRFIWPRDIAAGEGRCRLCNRVTCIHCRNPSHTDGCPKDAQFQATVQLGEAMKWKRCPSCRMMVGIDRGCNHISCRCGAQFCYVCARRWKTCSCEHATEANIIRGIANMRRAEAVAARQEHWRQPRQPERPAVDAVHRRFCAAEPNEFTRVECHWHERYVCEEAECQNKHRVFINACSQCHEYRCRACGSHRIATSKRF